MKWTSLVVCQSFFSTKKDERMLLICLQVSEDESNFIVPLEKDKLIYLQPSKYLDRLKLKQDTYEEMAEVFWAGVIFVWNAVQIIIVVLIFPRNFEEDGENVTKQLRTTDENSFAWRNLQLNSRVGKRFWSVGRRRLKVKIDALKLKTNRFEGLRCFVGLKVSKLTSELSQNPQDQNFFKIFFIRVLLTFPRGSFRLQSFVMTQEFALQLNESLNNSPS